MSKLIITLAFAVAVASLTGCSSLVKSATGKSVSLKGYGSVNVIDTGANPTTGTLTPHLTNIVGSVHHKSTIVAVPADQRTPNYVDYTRESSSSVFNSSATTVTTSFTISADSPEMIERYLERIRAIDAQNNQPKEASNE